METLKDGKLSLDWRKYQQTRAAVRVTIKDELDRLPLDAYPTDLYEEKCDLVYEHVYEKYFGEGKSVYSDVA